LFFAIFGLTQKEKDALVATLTAQKDTFPSMILIPFPISPVTHPLCFPVVEQLIKCPMCSKTFSDPRTLSCLHSFCLACLESQMAMALTTSSSLSCHLCRAPFAPPATGGVGAYTCSAFIDSLVKSTKANTGDANRVGKCDICDVEDATVHCVECTQHFCPACSKGHQKTRATASHQQIPLEEALAGNAAVKRIPRCQKHIGMEIDSYCKTCAEAICPRCAVERHSGHIFCPLSQVTGPLQDQIAGYTITMAKREEEARKVIATLDGTINKIEDHRSTAEKDIATFVSALHAAVDARGAVLVSEMQTKGNQLRKTAIQEKGEVESATVQFREFHTFTKGLLAQGTPVEIAGTHKMVNV